MISRLLTSVLATSAAATMFGLAGCAASSDNAGCPCAGACMVKASECVPSASLTQSERDALLAALQDERRTQSFYQSVMDRHGRVRPFVNIIQAECNHEQAVSTLMRRYALEVPGSAPIASVPAVPATLRESASLAARLERENIAMYDRLIQECHQPDVRDLFARLRAASKNNHLPAFERWAGT